MTCKVAMDLAELYKAKLVSPESAAEIREHLKTCPNCRRYYRNLDAPRITVSPTPSYPADTDEAQERLYSVLSRRLRRHKVWEIVGTSAAIGAGSIMLAVGLIMVTRSAPAAKEA